MKKDARKEFRKGDVKELGDQSFVNFALSSASAATARQPLVRHPEARVRRAVLLLSCGLIARPKHIQRAENEA